MQFSIKSSLSLFTILSASVHGYLQNISLYVDSDNTEINGNGLYTKHSGAGTDFFYLGTGADSLVFDSETKHVYRAYGPQYEQYFAADNSGFVLMTVDDAIDVHFTQINGGKQYMSLGNSTQDQGTFYACKNVNDPGHYSTSSYELMYYTGENVENDSCVSIKVYREVN
ncbi:unnamed protein product [Ambrosiozyma monospora]|uniref:Unnamed protein product n=1 Tax=Ambrosiozyma monospora TaxID=43982 RepID=A0ACB5SRY6_AMBMO|nr:unnamed protein product [Ambrosiozyma monospora]